MAFFLLTIPPFWAILLITFVITLATTLVYKYTTDQKRMRHLKDQSKKFQEKMKASRDDPQKLMKIQGEAMKVNLELMKHSLKPTLYTMLPLLIIFWWLNAHMAYLPLAPQQEFTLTAEFAEGIAGNATIVSFPEGITYASETTQAVTDGQVVWKMKANAGTYKSTVTFGGAAIEKQFTVTSEPGVYDAPEQTYKGSVERIVVGNKPTRPFGDAFNIFGWHPGWLATYITLSILISLGLRKALDVV